MNSIFLVTLLLIDVCLILQYTHAATDLIHKIHTDAINSHRCAAMMDKTFWYTEFHSNAYNATRHGSNKMKILLSISHDKGFLSRILGFITQLYQAMLSKRMLLVAAYLGAPSFDCAMKTAAVNFLAPRHKLVEFYNTVVKKSGGNNSTAINLKCADGVEPLFLENCNASKIFSPASTVSIECPAGYSYKLLNHTASIEKHRKIPIHPEDAVFCGFHYLMRPSNDLKEFSTPIIRKLFGDNEDQNQYYIIGIQIRNGDISFIYREPKKLNAEIYFDCARELERNYLASSVSPKKKVIWYLISDTIGIREDAAEKYGEKIVTDIENIPFHTQISPDYESAILGGRLVISEVMIYSLSDVFIISPNSVVGKFGILLSQNPKPNTVFSPNYGDMSHSNCSALSTQSIFQSY